MCAAAKGVVEDDGITGLHLYVLDSGLDGEWHRAEMNGQVVALRDGLAGVVVERARVVQAFLDVG